MKAEMYMPLEMALQNTPPETREVDAQRGYLFLDEVSLSGMNVCEIGTGREERLARYLSTAIGPSGCLTLINPDYEGVVDEEGNTVLEDTLTKGVSHARVKRFPVRIGSVHDYALFPPETFNLITSSFGVPLHLEKKYESRFYEDVQSALKFGGTARFYPMSRVSKYLRDLVENPPPGFTYELRTPQFSLSGLKVTSKLSTLVITKHR